MGAFATHEPCQSLEQAPLSRFRASGNPSLTLTRGIRALYGKERHTSTGGSASMTLPDGRLNAGTHLGLLASRYRYLSRISEGVTSQVLLVEDTFRPGTTLAVKATHRQYAGVGQQEARALRFLHSRSPSGRAPGMAPLVDSFMLGGHFCLVTERLYPRLLDWIADTAQQAQQEWLHTLRKVAHQLLASIAFLHQNNVVHADLKPDNILFTTPQGEHGVGVRVVDFGGSFSATETDTRRVVFEVQTLQYRAPEALLCLPYSFPIDVWSLGVLLAEVALKRPLLICTTPAEAVQAMTSTLGPFPLNMLKQSPLAAQLDMLGCAAGIDTPSLAQRPDVKEACMAAQRGWGRGAASGGDGASVWGALKKVDLQLADLVGRMLCYDPAQRITAAQALLHPFLYPISPVASLLPSLHLPHVHPHPPSPTQAASAPPPATQAWHPAPGQPAASAQQASRDAYTAEVGWEVSASPQAHHQVGGLARRQGPAPLAQQQYQKQSPFSDHRRIQQQQQLGGRQGQPPPALLGAVGQHAQQLVAQQGHEERSRSPDAWSAAQAQPLVQSQPGAVGISSNCPAADLVQGQRAQQAQNGDHVGIYAGPFSPPASVGRRSPPPGQHPSHQEAHPCPNPQHDSFLGKQTRPPSLPHATTVVHSRTQQAAVPSGQDPRLHRQQVAGPTWRVDGVGAVASLEQAERGPKQEAQHNFIPVCPPQGKPHDSDADREGTGYGSGAPPCEGVPLIRSSLWVAAPPASTAPLPPSPPCRPPRSSRRKPQGPQHLRCPLQSPNSGVPRQGSSHEPTAGDQHLPICHPSPSWLHGSPPHTSDPVGRAAPDAVPGSTPNTAPIQVSDRTSPPGACVGGGEAAVSAAGTCRGGACQRAGQPDADRASGGKVGKGSPIQSRTAAGAAHAAGATLGKRERGSGAARAGAEYLGGEQGDDTKRVKVKREGEARHLPAAAPPRAVGRSTPEAQGGDMNQLDTSASAEVAAAALQQLQAVRRKGLQQQDRGASGAGHKEVKGGGGGTPAPVMPKQGTLGVATAAAAAEGGGPPTMPRLEGRASAQAQACLALPKKCSARKKPRHIPGRGKEVAAPGGGGQRTGGGGCAATLSPQQSVVQQARQRASQQGKQVATGKARGAEGAMPSNGLAQHGRLPRGSERLAGEDGMGGTQDVVLEGGVRSCGDVDQGAEYAGYPIQAAGAVSSGGGEENDSTPAEHAGLSTPAAVLRFSQHDSDAIVGNQGYGSAPPTRRTAREKGGRSSKPWWVA